MAKQPESNYIQAINKLVDKRIYREKMHNEYRGGTPDEWYSGVRDIWVEYKWLPRMPVRVPLVPDLSPLQALWLRRRYSEGRSVFVIVGSPKGGVLFTKPEEWDNGIMLTDKLLLDKAAMAATIEVLVGVPE